MKNADPPELEKELEESFCSIDPHIARRFVQTTFYSDNRADPAKLNTPSLIIRVSDEAIAPISLGEFMHKKNLPNSNLRLMEASGHCRHMSHPEQTGEII